MADALGLPPGYAVEDSSGLPPGYALAEQAPAENPQFSPVETAGLGLSNIFGAGDAIGAFVNSRLRGGEYEDWRKKFGQAREVANEQNPIAHYAGAGLALGAEALLGGAVGKGLGAAGKGLGLAEKFLPWAEAHPVLSKVLSGAAAGAGYGAAGGAGEALSKGEDLSGVGSAALGGAGTGALLGGALGGIAGKAGQVFRKLPEVADKAIVSELRAGADKAGREVLRSDKGQILELVRSDPAIAKAVLGEAEKALPVLEQKGAELTSSLADRISSGELKGPAALAEHAKVNQQLETIQKLTGILENKASQPAHEAPNLFGKALHGAGPVAATMMAMHGNIPGAALALAAPHVLPMVGKAQRGAVQALAELARAAEAGNPRAVKLLSRIQAGQRVGMAGAGTTVGGVTASTLSQQQQSGGTGAAGTP